MKRQSVMALVLVLFMSGSGRGQEKREAGPEVAKAVCEDSRRLARLAQIDESPDAGMIRTQSAVWCAAREVGPSLSWQNKKSARFPSGAWSYPNGRTAKSSGGAWYYPAHGMALSSSGLFSYPTGKTAKLQSGRWQRPDGMSATESELMSWACEKLGDRNCRRRLSDITNLSGLDRELAIIELVWSAR